MSQPANKAKITPTSPPSNISKQSGEKALEGYVSLKAKAETFPKDIQDHVVKMAVFMKHKLEDLGVSIDEESFEVALASSLEVVDMNSFQDLTDQDKAVKFSEISSNFIKNLKGDYRENEAFRDFPQQTLKTELESYQPEISYKIEKTEKEKADDDLFKTHCPKTAQHLDDLMKSGKFVEYKIAREMASQVFNANYKTAKEASKTGTNAEVEILFAAKGGFDDKYLEEIKKIDFSKLTFQGAKEGLHKGAFESFKEVAGKALENVRQGVEKVLTGQFITDAMDKIKTNFEIRKLKSEINKVDKEIEKENKSYNKALNDLDTKYDTDKVTDQAKLQSLNEKLTNTKNSSIKDAVARSMYQNQIKVLESEMSDKDKAHNKAGQDLEKNHNAKISALEGKKKELGMNTLDKKNHQSKKDVINAYQKNGLNAQRSLEEFDRQAAGFVKNPAGKGFVRVEDIGNGNLQPVMEANGSMKIYSEEKAAKCSEGALKRQTSGQKGFLDPEDKTSSKDPKTNSIPQYLTNPNQTQTINRTPNDNSPSPNKKSASVDTLTAKNSKESGNWETDVTDDEIEAELEAMRVRSKDVGANPYYDNQKLQELYNKTHPTQSGNYLKKKPNGDLDKLDEKNIYIDLNQVRKDIALAIKMDRNKEKQASKQMAQENNNTKVNDTNTKTNISNDNSRNNPDVYAPAFDVLKQMQDDVKKGFSNEALIKVLMERMGRLEEALINQRNIPQAVNVNVNQNIQNPQADNGVSKIENDKLIAENNKLKSDLAEQNNKISGLFADVRGKDEEVSRLRGELEAVKNKNNELESKLNTKEEELKQEKDKNGSLTTENSNLKSDLAGKNTTIEALENSAKEQGSEITKLKAALEATNKEKEDLQAQLKAEKENNTSLTNDKESLTKEKDSLKADLKQEKDKNGSLTTENSNLKSDLAGKNTTIEALENSAKEQEEKMRKLEAELEAVKKERDDANKEKGDLQRENDQLNSSLNTKQGELKKVSDRVGELETKLKEAATNLKQEKDKNTILTNDKDSLTNDKDSLTKEKVELQKENNQLKTDLVEEKNNSKTISNELQNKENDVKAANDKLEKQSKDVANLIQQNSDLQSQLSKRELVIERQKKLIDGNERETEKAKEEIEKLKIQLVAVGESNNLIFEKEKEHAMAVYKQTRNQEQLERALAKAVEHHKKRELKREELTKELQGEIKDLKNSNKELNRDNLNMKEKIRHLENKENKPQGQENKASQHNKESKNNNPSSHTKAERENNSKSINPASGKLKDAAKKTEDKPPVTQVVEVIQVETKRIPQDELDKLKKQHNTMSQEYVVLPQSQPQKRRSSITQ
jgi:hypothetical protein